ncbi:MAG: DUF4954 family protein [Barnesiella sp.]|nr:DUF4954 family protein [Barnesiella sp.]
MQLRQLTLNEISTLTHQGCRSNEWGRVTVCDPFFADRYRDVTFIGDVELHPAEGEVALGALPLPAGVYNAVVINSVIGRGAHVSNIGNYMADCSVGENAVVRNVDTIECPEPSTHGNGVEVEVLSETGGREVPIYYGLTAQQAWLIAMGRHDAGLVAQLKADIAAKTAEIKGLRTIIGAGATVVDTGYISGVEIKPRARVNGASRLVNGTVGEEAEVGTDVIAVDFITARKSLVDKAARIDHVFVGEGSCVTNGFSAHHSLIFSNCILENGESAAIFAGPYTVSMHKATLLIGGMMSMFNAGSGANQSNHLYKSGPCHHGVLERGVKLASDAYVMWPARIGAFSTVMGRHKSHPDTSSLPFSYVVENNGSTQVIPAIALGNIGIARDIDKWPRRDRRPAPATDIITYPLFNPYIGNRIVEGIEFLTQLIASQPDKAEYNCGNFTIRKSHAERGAALYRDALFNYLATTLLQRIAAGDTLSATADCASDEWVDAAGMTIPADMITRGIPSPDEWESLYPALEWNWVASYLLSQFDIDVNHLDNSAISDIIDKWQKINASFDAMLLADAEKEFATDSPLATGAFGLFGADTRETDFLNVRGRLADSSLNALLTSRARQTATLSHSITAFLNRNS